jgi:hypothetical protein
MNWYNGRYLDEPEILNAKAQSGKEAKKRLFLLFFASFASLHLCVEFSCIAYKHCIGKLPAL